MKRICLLAFVMVSFWCYAGRVTDMVELRVAPASGGWTAETGEDVSFTFILTDNNVGIGNKFIEYEIGEDLMDYRIKGKVRTDKNGVATVKGGTMKQPGFLRCKAKCE